MILSLCDHLRQNTTKWYQQTRVYSNAQIIFISTHELCSKPLLCPKPFRQSTNNSWQSLFIATSNVWMTVARLNNSIILNKLNYLGSQNMQMWNTRIILIPYGLNPLSINKTPFIYHHINYSLFVVSVNQLLTWITTLVPCS